MGQKVPGPPLSDTAPLKDTPPPQKKKKKSKKARPPEKFHLKILQSPYYQGCLYPESTMTDEHWVREVSELIT